MKSKHIYIDMLSQYTGEKLQIHIWSQVLLLYSLTVCILFLLNSLILDASSLFLHGIYYCRSPNVQ